MDEDPNGEGRPGWRVRWALGYRLAGERPVTAGKGESRDGDLAAQSARTVSDATSGPCYGIYGLYRDLLPMGDAELLRRIYGFTEWCFEQRAGDLSNATGVGLYEHLFDSHPSHWEQMVHWLSPNVVKSCWPLWEWRLDADRLGQVRRLVADCRTPQWREALAIGHNC